MKNLFVLSTLLLFTIISFAQVPGYMGKHFSLYYEPTIGFAIQPKNTGAAGENKNTLGINFRNDFATDYVISRGVALGASVKLVSCKLNDALYYGYNQNSEYQIFSGDVKVKGSMFSFYIKNFNYKRRGFLAPTGVYSKWEVVYGKFKGSTGELLPPPPEWESAPAVSSVEDIYGSTPVTHLFGMIYSFGRQNLVSDKIFINTGASIGIMFQSLGTQSFMSGGPDYNSDYSQIPTDMQSRVANSLFLNFTLGIGWLALKKPELREFNHKRNEIFFLILLMISLTT